MRTGWSRLALCALCVMLGGLRSACAQSASAARKRVADPAAQALNDLLNAAQTAIDKQDFEGAAQDYRDYLAKKPDDALVHYDLGYAYSALNRPGEAKDEYQRAIALDPDMGEAYLNLGVTLIPSSPSAAVEPLRHAVELLPDDARAKWFLGIALENSGNLPDAIEQFRGARKRDDSNVDYSRSLAIALLHSGRAAEAEAEFRVALQLHGGGGPPALVHLGLAQALTAEKQFQEAIPETEAYLSEMPNDSKVRVDLASLLFDQGKYDDALAELDRAAKSGPEDLRAIKLRSDIFWQQKRYADAVAVLQKAAAVAPNDADITARLGEAYLHTKDYPNAMRWLATSHHLNPNANDVLAYLIDAEFGGKNYAQALAALDELSRREQLPMASWYVRAVCFDNLGQAAQALDAYQKFLQLNKDENSDMYFVSTARARVLTRELQNKKR
jgi:tetratricopeptide (TPR) repeat protein